jgi:hypothetical protein
VSKTLTKVGVDPNFKSNRPSLSLGKFISANKLDSDEIITDTVDQLTKISNQSKPEHEIIAAKNKATEE